MPAAMPRQKRYVLTFQRSHGEGIGRLAERRLDANLARPRQTVHGIKPAAADDADARLG